jgi:two-component system chemotaxis family response regulator WspR
MTDTPNQRVLLVDDDSLLCRALARAMGGRFEFFSAADGAEGLRMARELRPDVVIADHAMPKIPGVELLAQLSAELPETIRILMSGYADYRALSESLRAGVHHFVGKPFSVHELENVIHLLLRQRALETERSELHGRLKDLSVRVRSSSDELELPSDMRAILQTIDALQKANERLQELALRDALTNLYNRRYLLENLELELARSRRYERPFSLLFLDIDDFKRLNDNHGHLAGDSILRTVGEMLLATDGGIRSSDFAARYGGEEFCIVLPETPIQGAILKAERLRQTVAEHRWGSASWPVPASFEPVTVSIGVASYPTQGATCQQLLAAADAALYEAKRQGKNRVVVAS